MLRTIEARRILTIAAALAAIATPAGIQAQETAGQDSEGGLFAGIGLGMGVMDCFNSSGCYRVLAGNLRFGTRLSPHVAIAVGVEAFGAEDVGAALLSAQVLYYPTGGDMFVLAGAGAAFERPPSQRPRVIRGSFSLKTTASITPRLASRPLSPRDHRKAGPKSPRIGSSNTGKAAVGIPATHPAKHSRDFGILRPLRRMTTSRMFRFRLSNSSRTIEIACDFLVTRRPLMVRITSSG